MAKKRVPDKRKPARSTSTQPSPTQPKTIEGIPSDVEASNGGRTTSQSAHALRSLADRFHVPPLLLLILVLAVWFGPTLFGGQRLAFRDVGHFYLPLYEYLAERMAGFHLPQWNPLIQTGVPIVGDNTSAIFYPGRLVFLLGLPTESALSLYLMGHLVFAAFGARYAALRAGATKALAWVAGVSYALSAPVLQQYMNPPFLIGAAWLPWGVSALFQTVEGGSRRAIALSALCLAMPVLAGDPQATMHQLLIGASFWCWQGFRYLKARRKALKGSDSTVPPKTLAVVLACGLSFAAAMIQVIPTLQWSRFSGRNAEAPPGIARLLAGDAYVAGDTPWYRASNTAAHAQQIYNYTTGPWNVFELLLPNACGPIKPVSGRMSRLISGREVFWSTSIYCGLFGAVCFLAMMTGRRVQRWWWIALVGFWMATGDYGVIALIQQLGAWTGNRWLEGIDPAVATPYWFLVTFVPGYASFRYPSKWMPVVALGLAVGAAQWFSQADRREMVRLVRWLRGILIFALALFLVSFLPWTVNWAIRIESRQATMDLFYGPLNIPLAFFWFRIACVQTIVVGGILVWILKISLERQREPGIRPDDRLASRICMLVALDFLVAGGTNWIDRVPRERQALPNLSAHDAAGLKRTGAIGAPAVLRTLDDRTLLVPWLTTSSPLRLQEVDGNEQRTLLALWNLTHGFVNINAPSTITPQVHTSLWSEAAAMVPKEPTAADTKERRVLSKSWEHILMWMSVKKALMQGQPVMVPNPSGQLLMLTDTQWQDIPDPLPSVRWYNRWEPLPGDPRRPNEVWRSILPQVIENPREAPAWISTETNAELQPSDATVPNGEGATIEILSNDAEHVRIEVENRHAGWLYLHTFQDGNWHAFIEGDASDDSKGEDRVDPSVIGAVQPVQINLVGQGLRLPAGTWRVRFDYRPRWLPLGTVCSVVGWLGIGYLAYRSRRTTFSAFKTEVRPSENT